MKSYLSRCFILLSIVLSFASCTSDEEERKDESPKAEFGIYLSSGTSDMNEDIDDLILEEAPIISSDDIIKYYWDEHYFKMKEDTLIEKLVTYPVSGRSFVVVVNKERIYAGAFWTYLSSAWPPEVPLIYVEGALRIGDNQYNVELDERLYYIDYELGSNDPRSDSRIYSVLKELDKLKE